MYSPCECLQFGWIRLIIFMWLDYRKLNEIENACFCGRLLISAKISCPFVSWSNGIVSSDCKIYGD